MKKTILSFLKPNDVKKILLSVCNKIKIFPSSDVSGIINHTKIVQYKKIILSDMRFLRLNNNLIKNNIPNI